MAEGSKGLAAASAEQVRQINAAQRAQAARGQTVDPIQTTTVLKINQTEIARAVNNWNAAHPRKDFDGKIVSQVAAAGVVRHRWSWGRFTLTVR